MSIIDRNTSMKIYLDSVGCRLNQSEIEQFGLEFRARGHELTANPEDADLAVLNTCAVTAKATSESRSRARLLGEHVSQGVVLTGCWSTLKPQAAGDIPNIHSVVPNDAKDKLIRSLIPSDPIESEGGILARSPVPGIRRRTRAFIKVQDGCDLSCTYCVTTVARGPSRSIPTQEVIKAVQSAVRGGVKEAILTGVHLGSWGRDLPSERSLKHLIRVILDQTSIARLRLSSLEPWDLDEGFFSLWEDPRLCRHLHLPIQSGSDQILRRMGRRTTTTELRTLIEAARQYIPDVAITTDLIAGFPGESERCFEQSLHIIQNLSLAGGHVFPFSERPGTPAERMDGQVPERVRKDRARLLRASLRKSSHAFRSNLLGSQQSVLWESIAGASPEGFELRGWTDNYIRVQHFSPRDLSNQISPVKLISFTMDHSMISGELIDQ